MPILESIAFDVSDFQLARKDIASQFWLTPAGDVVSVHFFNQPPDLPANAKTIQDLQSRYSAMLASSPAKLVQVALTNAADCRAVCLIIKIPQQPSGLTYVGSITIPFIDYSYVLKVQCPEHGPTGLREAALLDQALDQGTATLDDSGRITGTWNPDDEKHDHNFPDHPLSRARRVLNQIANSCVMDAEAKNRDQFPLPRQ